MLFWKFFIKPTPNQTQQKINENGPEKEKITKNRTETKLLQNLAYQNRV